MINVRNILTAHRYLDKSTDLFHSLGTKEIDALCAFFSTCQENEDYDEDYVHTVADNVIRKRLYDDKHPSKTKTLTIYVDPKYERKLRYLKYTCGITTYIESCLDKLEVDDKLLRHIDALSRSV